MAEGKTSCNRLWGLTRGFADLDCLLDGFDILGSINGRDSGLGG